MLQLQTLKLPATLPHPDAIKSFKDNEHGYEPVFWEFQYHVCRYLERATDAYVQERYASILKNMQALISPDRDVIPIQSFLSSWYWFRKEHQTRLEMHYRGIEPAVHTPYNHIFQNNADDAPLRPKHPNAGDILYRYSKRVYLEQIVQGRLRIAPASKYASVEHAPSRQDDELAKRTYMPGAHTKITTQDGRNIPVIDDVTHTISSPNYYVFCLSLDWDKALFADFEGSDACLAIHDAKSVTDRIEKAAKATLPGWDTCDFPVHYFDPYERLQNEYTDPEGSKDFRFAYQRECRFTWSPPEGQTPEGFIHLNIGDISPFCTIYSLDGTTG